jgi:circadian clock protein KaiC
MDERIRSGVPGLDEVLGGGVPSNAINLIMGMPGTGKTVLAQQYVFANVADRPALYLSTASEPFEKIIRYGQGLEFFDAAEVGERVFYEDIGHTLLHEGPRGVLDQVARLLETHDPGLLVIDSFRPLAELVGAGSEYRRFLHELAARLTIRRLTSFWLAEYLSAEIGSAPEFGVADAVLWLASARLDDREVRLLQVLKLRGSSFLSGRHGYRLSAQGMRVFPRLAEPAQQSPYEPVAGNRSCGVKSLDAVIGGGAGGASTLVVGPSGSGKTVLGLEFATAGPRHREQAILATFDENPAQLESVAAGFGWSLAERKLKLMYRSPVDLYLDEWVYDLLALVESHDARRIVIDGLSNLRVAARDPIRFQEYLYSLVQRCSRRGTRLLMTIESPELFGIARLPEVPLSQIADNVVLLQFVRREWDYRRAMVVLKSRGAQVDPGLNEYVIGSTGIEVLPRRPSASERPSRVNAGSAR